MLSIERLREEIEKGIGELAFKREPFGLYEPIEYSMSLGGKRLRPVMCLAACSLFTDNYEKAMSAALAIEMFHNFTLLHDDVMDKADIRRNQPTVVAKWDANTAILSGDEMLIESYKLLAKTDCPAFSLVMSTFSETATEVCEGQQYDMDFETRDNVSLEEYMEMIRLKTAVLLGCAMKIGALIGGGNARDTEDLYEYSIDLGLAFQLQDDLLDTFGDEKTFGKAIGGDIMENKKTYLLISAMQMANTEQKEELTKWLGDANAPREQKVAAVKAIFEATGAKKATEAKMEQLYEKAMMTLREMDISAEGKRFFADFGDKLMKRKR